MSRKLSLTLGFGEREESILAYAEDDFDDWCEQPNSSTSRWRNSCPDQKSTATASRWGSRLTSLSTGLLGAGTALTTRAKQLCAGDSTHRAISQLRRSMVEVSSSRTLRGSTPTQHRFSESDIDCFKDVETQPEAEKAGDDECAHGKKCPKCALPSRGGKLKRLESSRSWTQGCS
ncbi:hypothetical protein PF005_g8783 [Phytophthora fragariae]|uniref:Uncharacterized protein n=2 Tax=Phytophthora TaxID=4783 RepID=A0A6A3SQU8_9STRA|nr:hypothetical protein PF003_g4052 [Phytophthora fragariae]KAE9029745.1 hypothetical protein PR002_g10058 [Phytophthora rubi]KAE8941861.1 hypothetical protein PF009_g8354 [Phytophthora fragariae]KAE9015049.1 hypothetical protein PF011_g7804 [Phytophthora fragariae]KAE9033667.1 hypothetical protein PR001_g10066 [Phytophthora rubi]